MRKKICTRCKIEKSIRCFWKRKPRRKGLAKARTVDQRWSHCKECTREKKRERQLSKSKLCQISQREYNYRRSYGITIDDYDKLFKSQDGKCAICDTTTPSNRVNIEHFAVDHDHKTGEVRGLLCSRCNFGLDHFKDDIVILENAIQYLTNN